MSKQQKKNQPRIQHEKEKTEIKEVGKESAAAFAL